MLGYLVVKSRRSFVHTGMESLVGEFAEVREPVGKDKEGKVFVFGELWNAKTDADREIPPKAVVVVKEVRNMLLVVEPKESE